MNILNTIYIKIAHIIAAVVVILGTSLSTVPPAQPPVTVIDLPGPTVQESAPTQTPTPAPVQPLPTQPTTTELPITPELVVTLPAEPTITYVPVYIIQPPPQITPMPEPTPQPIKASEARIEIISPMANKGLGREYLAREEVLDEANFVSIGAILYNDNGDVENALDMVVTATDTDQNRTIKGTGNIWGGRYVNGEKKPAYYYPYTYDFKTSGDHTLTFTANGQSKSITINVPSVDPR